MKKSIFLIPLFLILIIQVFDKRDNYFFIQIVLLAIIISYACYLLYTRSLKK